MEPAALPVASVLAAVDPICIVEQAESMSTETAIQDMSGMRFIAKSPSGFLFEVSLESDRNSARI